MSATDEERRKEVGRLIKQRYQALGMTVEQLADKAGYDEKTVRNIIGGHSARQATVNAILQVLKVEVPDAGALTEITDDRHGGYTKRAFAKYAGRYAAYRWSYDTARYVIRTVFTLSWSSAHACGVFQENQRFKNAMGKLIDRSQGGEVYANNEASVLHLLTVNDGLLRLITLTKMQEFDTVMRGSVLTQSRRTFSQQPAISPVILEKLGDEVSDEGATRLVGEITPTEPDYAGIVAALDKTEREVVLSTFSTEPCNLGTPGMPLGTEQDTGVFSQVNAA
jgi:transcriptional regulator with XRE-family HTH domain